MKSFKQFLNEGLTKTEQELMSRSRIGNFVYINGKQEHDAAKKLVAKGHAKKYDDVSYWSGGGVRGGEYYVNPFTRKQGLTKGKHIYGGTLYFHESQTNESKEHLEEAHDAESLEAEFVKHYSSDPMGVFMHAKSSYLDAVGKAKNFSMKAAQLNKKHATMSTQEFNSQILTSFVKHLKKHGYPKHASAGWGKAEEDHLKELMK